METLQPMPVITFLCSTFSRDCQAFFINGNSDEIIRSSRRQIIACSGYPIDLPDFSINSVLVVGNIFKRITSRISPPALAPTELE